MDYRDQLIVRPGHRVRLEAIDPGYRGKAERREKAELEIERYLAEMSALQTHKLVPKEVWKERYDLINEFERLLLLENTRIIKFFLYISKEEQLERFKQRLDDPARRWKISDADYKDRDFWDDYTCAYEDMLSKCSTKDAPWYVIPSNHKWFRNLAVSQIICGTLEDIGMKMPEPSVDIAAIRQMYHRAAKEWAKSR